MTQLCFFSNLTSSEWASWVQAIGSIIAILAAAGFVIWQHQLAEWRDRALALERHKETVDMYASVVDECLHLLEAVRVHAKAGTLTQATNNEFLIPQVIEAAEILQSCTSVDMKSAHIPLLMKQAHYHLQRARNDVFRDFMHLERGEKLEPGLDPVAQLSDVTARFTRLRASIAEYDARKRAVLIT